MKEYKYKINGNLYKVTIGNVEDNIADVEVNGSYASRPLPPPHRPHKCPNRPPLPASRA